MSKPIYLDNHLIGFIYLRANRLALEEKTTNYLFRITAILFLTLLIVIPLSFYLQKFISEPILDLATTANEVSERKDFGIRADYRGADEIGTLVERFNEMLSQIQKRDQSLNTYRNQLEELVHQRTLELQAAQKELVNRERLAAIGTLAAMVSHEIRNPLGTMRNSVYLLKTRNVAGGDPEIKNCLDRIDRNIIRCDHIIEDLLEFTRPSPTNWSWVELEPWLRGLLEENNIAQSARLEIRVEPLCVQILQERLRRAILNVVSNAIQAMDQKAESNPLPAGRKYQPALSLRAHLEGACLELWIADNGIGIKQEKLGKIFEPLFSEKNYGIGLGLPITRGIMQDHGGGAEAYSTLGEGTQIKLWFPLILEKSHEENTRTI